MYSDVICLPVQIIYIFLVIREGLFFISLVESETKPTWSYETPNHIYNSRRTEITLQLFQFNKTLDEKYMCIQCFELV